MSAGDMKEVIRLASEVRKQQAEEIKAKFEATSKERDALTAKLMGDFKKLINAYWDQIVGLVGDDKAMIKLVHDPSSSQLTSATIMKGTGSGAPRSASGGPPQKYGKTTKELLDLYGDRTVETPKGTMTFNEASQLSTDKNWIFSQVRQKLIKIDTTESAE